MAWWTWTFRAIARWLTVLGGGKRMGSTVSDETGVAAALLRIHRERDRLFGPVIFSNTSWDIALHLCANPSGCGTDELAATFPHVSENLLMRWVDVLERAGVVEVADQNEGQSLFLLTQDARAKLARIFEGLPLLTRA